MNRAPIVIAQRGLQISRDSFESQVSSIIQQVVTDYWLVVLAQDNLIVDRKAVEQAQVSYDHDKRSLELSALPPFDIYKSNRIGNPQSRRDSAGICSSRQKTFFETPSARILI